MPSARNQNDTLPQEASNTALFSMMLHYKREAEAAQLETERATKRVRTMETALYAARNELMRERQESNERETRVQQVIHGGNIIIRNLDDLYGITVRMIQNGVIDTDAREQVQRVMLRTDVGYSIFMGAPFLDLTANEELQDDEETVVDPTGEETETDEEVEL